MSENRKRQIIAEATGLFSHYGYDRVTIKQLADACGITEPALYRYFSSKEAIYDAVLDSLKDVMDYQELFDRLNQSDDLEEIMPGIARHILSFFKEHRELYRLLLYSTLREHRKAREVFRAIRTPYVEFLTLKLDELYDKGKVKKKNNEITARCFIGMVFDCALNATMWKGFMGKTYTAPKVIANNVPIFVDGLIKK